MHITRHDDGLSLSLFFSIRWIFTSARAHTPQRCATINIAVATRESSWELLTSYYIVSVCHLSTLSRRLAGWVCVYAVVHRLNIASTVYGSRRRRYSLVDAHRHCVLVLFDAISSPQRFCVGRMVCVRYMFGLAWAWLGKHELNYTSTMFVYISHCSLSCSMRPSCEQNMRRGSWFQEYIYTVSCHFRRRRLCNAFAHANTTCICVLNQLDFSADLLATGGVGKPMMKSSVHEHVNYAYFQ